MERLGALVLLQFGLVLASKPEAFTFYPDPNTLVWRNFNDVSGKQSALLHTN